MIHREDTIYPFTYKPYALVLEQLMHKKNSYYVQAKFRSMIGVVVHLLSIADINIPTFSPGWKFWSALWFSSFSGKNTDKQNHIINSANNSDLGF